MAALLLVACIAAASSACNSEQLAGSFITLRITGGYSEVRSSEITFRCSDGDVAVEAVTTYWRPEVPQEKRQGRVAMDAYVAIWKRLDQIGIWQLKDKSYAGEDFLTYTLTLGTRSRTHRVVVQNPREQEDQRYNEAIKEVIELFNTLK